MIKVSNCAIKIFYYNDGNKNKLPLWDFFAKILCAIPKHLQELKLVSREFLLKLNPQILSVQPS